MVSTEGAEAEGRPASPHGAVFGLVAEVGTTRRAGDAARLAAAAGLFLLTLLGARLWTLTGHDGSVTWSAPDVFDWTVVAAQRVGWIGSVLVVACAAVIGRRPRMVLDVLAGATLALAVFPVVVWLLGVEARPNLTTGWLSTYAVTVALALALSAGPHLTRPTRRGSLTLAALAVVATYLSDVPVSVVTSGLLTAWGTAAVVHLLFGSPDRFPSAAEVTAGAGDLGVVLQRVSPAPHQSWGVARFDARRPDGSPATVVVYGRDAVEAQVLSRTWRALLYRDGEAASAFSRRQQVEHEAFVTLSAQRAGVCVPDVVVAGLAGATEDALLVEVPPAGTALADIDPNDLTDERLDACWRALGSLHDAGFAHGSLGPAAVLVPPAGQPVGLVDLRRSRPAAEPERLHRDTATLLVGLAAAVGSARAVASLHRMRGDDTVTAALPYLQAAALDGVDDRSARPGRALMKEVRAAASAAVGVEEPQLAELRRVKPSSVLMVVATLFGFWLLVSELVGVGDVWSTIATGQWEWVAVTAVLAQLAFFGTGAALTGTVDTRLPYGPVVTLEVGLAFTGLIGGAVANTATIIRFFQRRGLVASVAVSSGLLASVSGFVVQVVLGAICLPLVWGDFTLQRAGTTSSSTGTSSSGGDTSTLLWVLVGVVVFGVVVGIVVARPRFRRMVVDRVKPQLDQARDNLSTLWGDPRRLLRLFLGNAFAQVVLAMALWAALHAYGETATLPALIMVNTAASLLGGLAPIPGGMGVVEATMAAGLTAYGIPASQSMAAVLTYRLFTSYLTPAWGWPALAWLRRHEYL